MKQNKISITILEDNSVSKAKNEVDVIKERLKPIEIDFNNVSYKKLAGYYERGKELFDRCGEMNLTNYYKKNNIPYVIFEKSEKSSKYSWDDLYYYIEDLGDPKVTTLLTKLKDYLLYCPASTKYHGSYFGGLLDHIVSVVSKLGDLVRTYHNEDSESPTYKSLLKCALLHDLGKLGVVNSKYDYPAHYYLVNSSGDQTKEPFISNKKLVSMPHELRSLYIIHNAGISLTEAEYQAIFYHAGMYMPGFRELVQNPSKTQYLMHAADNLSAQVLESDH